VSGVAPTASIVAGRLRITNGADTNFGMAIQTIPLINGRTYRAIFTGSAGTGDVYYRLTPNSNGSWSAQNAIEVDPAQGDYSADFTATAAPMYLVAANNGAGNTYVEFSRLSIILI
jgi:hypothetical protein